MTPLLKRGVKLPKTDSQCSTANEFFKSALFLNGPIALGDLNGCIETFNDVIYNYFVDNYGYPESANNKTLVDKYRNHTTKDLRGP